MAKKVNRLSALKVKQTKAPGWYPDGDGLYLQISKTGSKSFVYRYKVNGKERRHGLGAYPAHTLEMARNSADTCRRLRTAGYDPIDKKKQEAAENRLKDAKSKTFKECAEAYIKTFELKWKNEKHRQQWKNTLETYAYPVIGDLSVQDIDTALVTSILEPMWSGKTETATRVRQRIENVLDWSKVKGYRAGENPARWRGHLDKLFPKRSEVQVVHHFSAMPYKNVPDYFRELRKVDSIAAKALAFTILTVARNSEAREARWSEIDLDEKVWTIPAERMKKKRIHRVPLSREAIKILKEVKGYDEDYLFPGARKDKPISEATVRNQLRSTHNGMTVHGFRSSFCDWCAETTNHPHKLVEKALAHRVKDDTEKAYQRGDLLQKRKKVMDSWSDYCLNLKAGKVVKFRKKA